MDKILLVLSLLAILTSTIYMLFITIKNFMDKDMSE